MDERQRQICDTLRKLDEETAIQWFKGQFPIDDGRKMGEGMKLIGHRSWKKRSQIELAHYYLGGSGVLSHSTYFAKFMSIKLLVSILEKYLQNYDPDRLDLLRYNIISSLRRNAKTDKDSLAIERFSKKIDSLSS